MQFLILLHGSRPTLLADITPEEGALVGAHFAYLQESLSAGKLLLAGRCENSPFGLVVLTADTEAEARRFLEGDPAVKNGVFRGELHPFRLALFAGAQPQA